MRTLDIHPAFGYESYDRWNVAVLQRDDYLRQAGTDPTQASHRYWGGARMICNNISKIASYFPGLNVIVGIGRIILSARDSTQDPVKKAINKRHIYRGIGEIFLGPILIVADIILTIRDKKIVKNYSNQGN